jgi:hypothetical protein
MVWHRLLVNMFFLANVGIGYQIKDKQASIEFSYSISLVPVRNNDRTNIYIAGNQRNNTLNRILSN